MIFIFVMALVYNFPRFFDTTYTAVPTSFVQRIGNLDRKRHDRPDDFQIVKVIFDILSDLYSPTDKTKRINRGILATYTFQEIFMFHYLYFNRKMETL